MKRRFVILGVLAAFGAGSAGWAAFGPLDERTALLLRQSHGSASAGSKLGVRIGATWGEADHTLRQHSGIGRADHRLGWSNERFVPFQDEPLLVGQSVASYRDTSWRNGVVTLLLDDGIVARVDWNYVGPLYIDF